MKRGRLVSLQCDLCKVAFKKNKEYLHMYHKYIVCINSRTSPSRPKGINAKNKKNTYLYKIFKLRLEHFQMSQKRATSA